MAWKPYYLVFVFAVIFPPLVSLAALPHLRVVVAFEARTYTPIERISVGWLRPWIQFTPPVLADRGLSQEEGPQRLLALFGFIVRRLAFLVTIFRLPFLWGKSDFYLSHANLKTRRRELRMHLHALSSVELDLDV